jgi:hypothetical protein
MTTGCLKVGRARCVFFQTYGVHSMISLLALRMCIHPAEFEQKATKVTKSGAVPVAFVNFVNFCSNGLRSSLAVTMSRCFDVQSSMLDVRCSVSATAILGVSWGNLFGKAK